MLTTTVIALIQAVMSYVKALLPGLKVVHFVCDSPNMDIKGPCDGV